ncbi:MAG: hypothetical protein R2771_03490 [Saprospiraceae bacterium]
MKSINITAFTEDPAKIEAIKDFLDTLKIKFNLYNIDNTPYNTDFVKKILKGDEDLSQGMGRKINIEDLDKLWK